MKEIPNLPGYFATPEGHIWSMKTWRFLKEQINAQGYLVVGICHRGKPSRLRVHRLVGMAYLPNPERKPFINHKDCDRQNNAVANLEWCTRKENEAHKVSLGRQFRPTGELHPKAKLTRDIAAEIRRAFSSKEANGVQLAKKYNVHSHTIYRIVNGEGWL